MADLDRRVARLESLIAERDCACSDSRVLVVQRSHHGESLHVCADTIIAEPGWTEQQTRAAVDAAHAPCPVHRRAREFLLFDSDDLRR
jgi:hypothetical protein